MKYLLLLAVLSSTSVAEAAVPAPAPASVPAPEAAPAAAVSHPIRLSFAETSAFGATHSRFFNQLIGARLDYRVTPRFAFGAALSYANLKGKDGRVHNALPEVLTEYRLPIYQESVAVPFRFALGFLHKNGPTLRLAVGIDFALSDTLSLELVPLESMLWVTRERPEVSLDASVALGVAF